MKKDVGTHRLIGSVFFCFSLPAIIFLIILSTKFVQKQRISEMESYQRYLSVCSNTISNSTSSTSSQLSYITLNSMDYQFFLNASDISEQYQYAKRVLRSLESAQYQAPFINSFVLYDANADTLFPIQENSIVSNSLANQQTTKQFMQNVVASNNLRNRWTTLELSDRLIYIYTSSTEASVLSAVFDFHPDHLAQSGMALEDECRLFVATADGQSFYPKSILQNSAFEWSDELVQDIQFQGHNSQLIKSDIENTDLFICMIVPQKSIVEILAPSERLLLLAIIVLLLCFPLFWSILYRRLLIPLRKLSDEMLQIAKEEIPPCVSEDYSLIELKSFSKTLNYMLDRLHDAKQESYEYQLDCKQAEMQYLRLQIKPHFYINCLKNIYSLASQQQYSQIQDVALSLSDYFRYIFRDSQEMVSLAEELRSVEAYVQLQTSNYSRVISLNIDISVATSDLKILPFSVLTFVENSIKHSPDVASLTIGIKSSLLTVGDKHFLNITVIDDGNGFPPETLNSLNNLESRKTLYASHHVGIFNVYYRMKLTYQQDDLLFFYNHKNGSCVEINIPVKQEATDL